MSFYDASDGERIKESKFSTVNGTISKKDGDSVAHKMLDGFENEETEILVGIPTNAAAARRGTSNRSSNVHTPFSGVNSLHDGLIVEDGQKIGHEVERKSQALFSGLAYCISSCSMILLNKVMLSSFGFDAGISLMFYQNFIAVIIVLALSALGIVTIEKLTWRLVHVWVPVNIIFVGMLVTGMYSLKYINVAMVTILKNGTNILTAIGEAYIFRRHQNAKVWAALSLMIISAISGGITDLSFDARGYTWQAVNCIMTASYSLTLRRVMDVAKQATRSGSLNEISMVLLNNSLSLPFALFLIILFDEWEYVYSL